MSDVIKWGLLVIGILGAISLLFALPIVVGINTGEFANNILSIIETAGNYLTTFRNFINNFFTPSGRMILSAVLWYGIGKFFITKSIYLISFIYHFIFK